MTLFLECFEESYTNIRLEGGKVTFTTLNGGTIPSMTLTVPFRTFTITIPCLVLISHRGWHGPGEGPFANRLSDYG